jgi:hypothetical protein
MSKTIKKYNHVEAFCLMFYRCEKCGQLEVLWNSRDGVTPFIIGCSECDGNMVHINMKFDHAVEDHIVEKGERVFIDMPESLKETFARRSLKAYKESKYYDPKEIITDEITIKETVDNMKLGEPYVITI